jgi:hypothetical protein
MTAAVIPALLGFLLWSVPAEAGSKEKRAMKQWPPHYQLLAEACEGKQGGCCVDSVRSMAKGSYQVAPSTGCPPGHSLNRLRCVSSYKWCEPSQ